MTSRTPDDRMTRNAASLIASSAITAVLGLVFWVAAARLLSTGDVGIGTAIVASIILLGNVATLGLRSGLIRFMAAAGSHAGRFIGTAYALCATVAVVIATGYVIGTPLWAKDLIVLRQRPIDAVLFAMACAVWTVFVLQDNVLTGLRQAVWVPVENLGYSIAKLVLVVLLAATGAWALPVAWTVPALIAIVPVNLLVFRRLLGQDDRPPADTDVFTVRAIARFSIGDYAADIIRLLGAEVVVLFVLANRGAEDTAYVFFAMTIAATGQLVTANIVTAFIAEAAARPAHALDLARRAAVQSLAIIVPGALVGVALAPLVLRVFGETYAVNGTLLLRLLALGAIPLAVVGLGLGSGARRTRHLVGHQNRCSDGRSTAAGHHGVRALVGDRRDRLGVVAGPHGARCAARRHDTSAALERGRRPVGDRLDECPPIEHPQKPTSRSDRRRARRTRRDPPGRPGPVSAPSASERQRRRRGQGR